MDVLRPVLVAVVAGALLTGCTSSGDDAGGLASCGSLPSASGPDAGTATLTLAGPGTGASGSTVRPTLTIRVTGSQPPRDLGAPAAVLIVRGGKVVGAYRGAVGGTGLIVTAQARDAEGQQVPVEPVLLSGCPAGKRDDASPDATRRPLPAGEYQLIARMEGYEYGRAPSVLVSAPLAIRVT